MLSELLSDPLICHHFTNIYQSQPTLLTSLTNQPTSVQTAVASNVYLLQFTLSTNHFTSSTQSSHIKHQNHNDKAHACARCSTHPFNNTYVRISASSNEWILQRGNLFNLISIGYSQDFQVLTTLSTIFQIVSNYYNPLVNKEHETTNRALMIITLHFRRKTFSKNLVNFQNFLLPSLNNCASKIT